MKASTCYGQPLDRRVLATKVQDVLLMVPREAENVASVGARWKHECKRHQSGRVPYADGAV